MQREKITTTNEIRITRGELLGILEDKHEFLWHFAKKMAGCNRCRAYHVVDEPYRIFINGYGDFMLYNRCADCDYPVRSYVDLSQDTDLRRRVRAHWLAKFN